MELLKSWGHAVMSTVSGLMTAEDLWNMPDDGTRRELVRGELRTRPPAGFEHGDIGLTLGAMLKEHVKKNRLGKAVGADTGFILARDPDVVRAPDAGFVSRARIEQLGVPKQFFPGAPDLAVEIVSPGDTMYEIEEKVDDFLAAGTRLVWVVNPRRRTVTVYRPGPQVDILKEAEQLSGEDVVPGFTCRVGDLFET
jgi:Uma2 family endonuclease